jgi:hypothetical protein
MNFERDMGILKEYVRDLMLQNYHTLDFKMESNYSKPIKAFLIRVYLQNYNGEVIGYQFCITKYSYETIPFKLIKEDVLLRFKNFQEHIRGAWGY